MATELHQDHNRGDIPTLQELLRLGLTIVTEVWTYKASDWVTSVHAADIDNDGDIEVLFVSRDGSVRALTKQGNSKWKRQVEEERYEWLGTVFGVANAQGKTRVLVGAHNNKVYALDKSGDELWKFSTGQAVRQVYVQDINHDGRAEVIVGSEDRWVYALDCETGRELWKYPTDGWVRAVFPCDVDGDGKIETLSGSGDKHLYVIDSQQGQLKRFYNINQKIYSLFASDIDEDGNVEIIVGSEGKDLYALKLNGQEKWRLRPAPENRILSLYVTDINNDGRNEIIAGSEDKHIYFLDDQGKLLWRHYLGARVLSVYANDIDGDGLVEILVGAEDNSIHVLHVDLTASLKELHKKILACYKRVGLPPTSLNLSPTECALLRDLIREDVRQQKVTTGQVRQLLKSKDHVKALLALLQLEQQKVQMLWGKSKKIGYVRAVCFGDIVGNGKLEIIVGTYEGEIKGLNARGDLLWSRPLPEQRIVTLQIGDIDGDEELEVVACTYSHHVYVLNDRGKFISKPMQEWISSIYIHELKDRTHTEIVMGSEANKIYLCNGNLEACEVIPTLQGIRIVCIHDLGGDGMPEIIAGTIDNHVYAYTRTGEKLWEYKTSDNVHALCVKDIDADGQSEIIVGSEDRNVHVLDSKGHLKWRYYTPHRVLDVDAIDVDQDGNVEVLLGVGDGYMYVLNGYGDLLWKYQANDRVRVVRAQDINMDGKMEVVLGSGDRLYLLQPIQRQWLNGQIEQCWSALQGDRPAREVLHELVSHPDAHLRAFALSRLATQPDLNEQDCAVFQLISKDSSLEERIAFARVVPLLYGVSLKLSQQFLNALAADPEQDVRLALVDSLAALAEIDQEIGFEGLTRFTRNIDRWVKRAVVRKLYQLIPSFPERVFNLLLYTARDENNWVQQESARTLAYYFDVHSEEMFERTFSLLTRGIKPTVIQQIAHSTTNALVQRLFYRLFDLLSELDGTNVSARLEAAVQVLEETRSLPYGEATWQVCHELGHVLGMQTIEDIARYQITIDHEIVRPIARFATMLELLSRLASIARILRTYLKREVLIDRLTNLLDADEALKKVDNDVMRERGRANEREVHLPDQHILQFVVAQWREIVAKELSRLRGKAELQIELQRRPVQEEGLVSFVLVVHNSGHSPADHVKVTLRKNNDFEVIGSNVRLFDSISTAGSQETEFTIKTYTAAPHLVFELVYSDAEALDKVFTHSERVELQVLQRKWSHIRNPYNSGTPIRDSQMFYGRQEDLRILKESLTNSSTNMVVVLSGQRRSGKTSLLYQLVNTPILEPHIPVLIDMHAEGLEFSQSRFFYHVAFYIHRELRKKGLVIDTPNAKEMHEDPMLAFKLFLESAERLLQGRRLVLLIDEFEILEEKVKEKAIAEEIAKYLRSLMQHGQGINFLLSGTRKMRELTDEYWSVFFNIARQHRLSKLSEVGAIQLIREPVEQFLEYDPFAIKKIRQLTADQPYFIHLMCGYLVDHCNAIQRGYVTLNDVNTVLGNVVETCHNHFTWMWGQSSREERLVLSLLAEGGGDEGQPLSLLDIEELYHHYHLPYNQVHVIQALENLIKEEIIEGTVAGEVTESVSERTRCRILVGLTRVWLRKVKSL